MVYYLATIQEHNTNDDPSKDSTLHINVSILSKSVLAPMIDDDNDGSNYTIVISLLLTTLLSTITIYR